MLKGIILTVILETNVKIFGIVEPGEKNAHLAFLLSEFLSILSSFKIV